MRSALSYLARRVRIYWASIATSEPSLWAYRRPPACLYLFHGAAQRQASGPDGFSQHHRLPTQLPESLPVIMERIGAQREMDADGSHSNATS